MTEIPTVQRPLDHHGGPRLRGLGAPPEPRADRGRFRWLIDGLKPLELPDATLTALAGTMVDESGGGGWSGQPTAADNPARVENGALNLRGLADLVFFFEYGFDYA